MSQSATYVFGSKVYCSDADCGELLHLVVEPEGPRLRGLVVAAAGEAVGRVVAPDLARVTAYGVLLGCERAAFERMPVTALRGGGEGGGGGGHGEQTRIRRGDRARALDGDAGRVIGLVVRGGDEAVTHVLLVAGRLWRRRRVAVPVEYVAGLGFAGLDLLVRREDVGGFGEDGDGGL